MTFDVAIIGAGVCGAMIARELSKFSLKTVILEKENDVACGASKANSGIIHGGFDPEPGTLKAKLNISGISLLYDVAKELNVPHVKNGSMVCAFDAEQDETIKKLFLRGKKNGCENLKILSGDEARVLEPELSSEITSVLHVPDAGIICPYQLTIAATGNAMDNGTSLKCNFKVSGINKLSDAFEIIAENGDSVKSRYIVNCSGGFSDKISALVGDSSFSIIPRAGEYMLLDKAEGKRVSHTIFQVPTKEGKGILVSPTADGNLLVGPTASVVESPESVHTTDSGLAMVKKFSAKSVPSIDFRQGITSFTGVRASEKNGDFIIEPSKTCKNFLNVAAIDSPGLSSCVSIALYAIELLREMGLRLIENKSFCGARRDMHAFEKMNDEEKDAYIKEHPDYGKIICRCETISEGEIRDAIRTNPPARDVDGVKRRTRSGMGRCQGGFCLPSIIKIIAEETGVDVNEVTKSGGGGVFVTGRI